MSGETQVCFSGAPPTPGPHPAQSQREVLPRRDAHLAAAEAATFAVQIPRRAARVLWRDREMVERWVASGWLLKEKNFRKIYGHRDLWALAGILGRQPLVQPIAGEISIK